MKKRIVLIVSIVLVIIAFFAVGAYVLFDTSKEPTAKILLADYNHYDAKSSDGNSLVQVGARLYYSVDSYENPVKYGLYEITNREIKRIWWDGIKSPKESSHFNNLAVYDDSLAQVDPQTGVISLFNFEKGEFVKSEGAVSEYVKERNKFQKYQTENDSAVFYTNLFGKEYYIVDRDATPVLYRDVPDSEEDELLFDFSLIEGGVNCRDMYSRNATVYVEYVGATGVCCLEYYVETNEAVIIENEDYIGRYACDDYAVKVNNPVSADKSDPSLGIYVTDYNTKETKKVYDGYVADYHILDNQWIYFTLDDYSLWRVSADGKTLEQVF